MKLLPGVKDASDKKILVDMLFWAVDNPAPANYLLISGDGDFSNALHQLRMRRYNILLAQPLKATAPLVAAAKSVWLWTSLLSGGAPQSSGESSIASNNHVSYPARVQNPIADTNQLNQLMVFNSEDLPMESQKTYTIGRVSNLEHERKYVLKTENQPNISRPPSLPLTVSECTNNDPLKPAQSQMKLFRKAPHEFFCSSEPVVPTSRSTPNLQSNQDFLGTNMRNSDEVQVPLPQDLNRRFWRSDGLHMQSMSGLENLPLPVSHTCKFQPMPLYFDGSKLSAGLSSIPDIHKLHICQYSNNIKSTPICHQQTSKDSNPSTTQSPNLPSLQASSTGLNKHGAQAFHYENLNQRHHRSSEHMLSSYSSRIANTNCDTNYNNVVRGVQGCQPPSEHAQGLIGVILLALNTLKVEKVMPTESNIINCIFYGDPKYRTTDVKKALDCAIKHCMVSKQSLGALQFYVGRNEKLWKCVNLTGGNPNQYPKTTWVGIERFLTSSSGRTAILASRCG